MLNCCQSHHIALLDFQRAVFENMSINLQPFQLLSSHVRKFFLQFLHFLPSRAALLFQAKPEIRGKKTRILKLML